METASRIWQKGGGYATGTRNCSNNSTIRSQSSRPPLKAIPCGHSAFTKTNNGFCFPLVWRRPRENRGPALSKSFCLGSQQVIASPPVANTVSACPGLPYNCEWACDEMIRQHLTNVLAADIALRWDQAGAAEGGALLKTEYPQVSYARAHHQIPRKSVGTCA